MGYFGHAQMGTNLSHWPGYCCFVEAPDDVYEPFFEEWSSVVVPDHWVVIHCSFQRSYNFVLLAVRRIFNDVIAREIKIITTIQNSNKNYIMAPMAK